MPSARAVLRLALGCSLLFLACCSRQVPSTTSPGSPAEGTYTVYGRTYRPLTHIESYSKQGIASWYGPKFQGRPTANGEIYNMYSMTAAHRILPFQTRVKVTNLENGKTVQVRINDRGPFVKNRLIDLSYSAARELGMIGQGTAPVKVEAVQVAADQDATRYFVQLGSFSELQNARQLLRKTKKRGYSASRIIRISLDGRIYYRVQAGSFPNLALAQKKLHRLRQAYPSSFIIAD
jgi:rare lipoprotein A